MINIGKILTSVSIITRSYLKNMNLEENKVTPDSILKGLDICLKNKFFQFKNRTFQQISGVGTGLKLAPPYACLGMGEFEKQAFSSPQPLLDQILLWKRYIDDVFGLFKGSKEEFDNLVTWLNSLQPGVVKFTANISYSHVEFLDLVIRIENGKLESELFVKPSNLQLYLNYNSNHPEPCKTGLVYGQALRIVERCSNEQDAEQHLQNLKKKLLDRKYPEEIVKKEIFRAQQKDRKSLIFKKKQKPQTDKKVRLIFTFNQHNPPIQKWIRQSRKYLDKTEKAKELGRNIQIAYKQPKKYQKIGFRAFRKWGEGARRTPRVLQMCQKVPCLQNSDGRKHL